ncbi:hypothetical protein GmHk_14G042020 [Glycine max]|nr:hypothetical protein GmHk_14G042020 [Glycine max]
MMYGAFQELSIKRRIPSSTNKVLLDSTLGLPKTLLLVTIWYTCQRVNRFGAQVHNQELISNIGWIPPSSPFIKLNLNGAQASVHASCEDYPKVKSLAWVGSTWKHQSLEQGIRDLKKNLTRG